MTQLETERALLSLPREAVQGTPIAAPLAQLRAAKIADDFDQELTASGRLRQAWNGMSQTEQEHLLN